MKQVSKELSTLTGSLDCLSLALLNAIIIMTKVFLKNYFHLTFKFLTQENIFTALDFVRSVKSMYSDLMNKLLQKFCLFLI